MTTNLVIKANTFDPGINVAGGGTVTLEQDAYVFAVADNGIEAVNGPWTFNINGVIVSDLYGMVLYDTGIATPIANAKITVGTESVIVGGGAGDAGIYAAQAADITNSGRIQGKAFGIQLEVAAPSSTKAMTITNNVGAEITGSTAGIVDHDTAHSLTVNNKGDISGVEWIGAATITNSGFADFFVQLTPFLASDTITNSGIVGGNVSCGEGNDVVKNTGQIHGALNVMDGNNTVTNSGEVADLTAGSGNDTVTNSGFVDHFVHVGDGKNSLTDSGTISEDVQFGQGDDTLSTTVTGQIGANVDMGIGKNTVTNAGGIGATSTSAPATIR